MIKRLHIQNYMAHKDTTLELDPGVTVLTGPNNSGKSAAVEAIRSLAMNPAPHHVIRHGASKALVRAELDTGEVVEWVRAKGNTVYNLYRNTESGASVVEPETYAKFGRTPPEDVRAVLRLDPVETETGAVDIHIGNQRYPVFLLDQTGSQAASFFAASTEAEYLLRMQQALKTRTDRAKSDRKRIAAENEYLEELLGGFLPLEGIERDLSAAEELHESLKRLQAGIPVLEKIGQALDAANRAHDRAHALGGVLGALSGPPDLWETKVLDETLEDLARLEANSVFLEESRAALHPLDVPPVIENTAELAVTMEALEYTVEAHGRQSLAEMSLRGLESPPQLQDTVRLVAALEAMERGMRALGRASTAGQMLAAVKEPPPTHDTQSLDNSIGALSQIQAVINRCTSLGTELEKLRQPCEPNLLDPMKSLVRSLEEMESRLGAVEIRAVHLDGLQPCPEFVSVAPLEEMVESMSRLHSAAHKVDGELREIVQALDLKLMEVEARVTEAGVCPLCGHPMDLEHFVGGIHA